MTTAAPALLRRMFDAAVASAQPALRIPQQLPSPASLGAGRLVVIGAGQASAAMARAVEDHWHGPAVRPGGHALRLQRALPAHRDRRGLATGARRSRAARGRTDARSRRRPAARRPGAVPDLGRRLVAAALAGAPA
jgi:hypothetical protein